MGNTVEVFGWRLIKPVGFSGRPMNPIVQIFPRSWSSAEGVETITLDLMREREIDVAIQELKEDLDNVGRKAKADLRRAKAQLKMIKPAGMTN